MGRSLVIVNLGTYSLETFESAVVSSCSHSRCIAE
eukprot:COSAG01_NODE_9251_length_2504_cov_2.227027_5_plen_34_part_01